MRGWIALGMLCWLGLGWTHWTARAQGELVPEPQPTNAVGGLERRLSVEGWGKLPRDNPLTAEKAAYQAALLDAYQKLVWQGAQEVGLLPEAGPCDWRSFRLDEVHPNPALLDWLLRSQVVSQKLQGDRLKVTMESPPLTDINRDQAQPLKSLAMDIDGDQQPEHLVATAEGRIYLMKAGRILATSPCLNAFSASSLRQLGVEPWVEVQLTRLVNLSSPELVGKDRLRLVAELTLGESVDQQWVGKASEQREVLLRWDEPASEPQIEVEEPSDFLSTLKDKVAWKGLLLAPAGLASAKLRVNGRPFWQTPENLNSRRLRMDIQLSLLPGVNRAQVQIDDKKRRSLTREVLLFREAACPPVKPARRRALLIGADPLGGKVNSDLARLGDSLQRPDGGAIPKENTIVLLGAEATRAKILESLAQLTRVEPQEERVFVFVYFAGLGLGGKGLLPSDAQGSEEGAITSRDLLKAVGDLKQQDLLLLLDTSRGSSNALSPDQLWLDSQEFAESLARRGWAVLSHNAGSLQQRDDEAGSRLVSAWLQGCRGEGDLNGDGVVEWEEIYRSVFQTLQRQSPLSAPLRRGQLLGKVPVALCPKK